MPAAPRKPRADASRNRDRVLTAARDLFTERGADVQMPEVARAAGVGIGTVYRHFPSREALIEAAAAARFAEMEVYARAECATGRDGLARYLHHVGEVLSADRGLSLAVEARHGTTEPHGESRAALEEAVTALIASGRDEGSLRPDAALSDVDLIACGLSAVIRWGGGDWRRYLEIALRGLRP